MKKEQTCSLLLHRTNMTASCDRLAQPMGSAVIAWLKLLQLLSRAFSTKRDIPACNAAPRMTKLDPEVVRLSVSLSRHHCLIVFVCRQRVRSRSLYNKAHICIIVVLHLLKISNFLQMCGPRSTSHHSGTCQMRSCTGESAVLAFLQ